MMWTRLELSAPENRFDIYVKVQDKLILELFLDSNHEICTDMALLSVKVDFYSWPLTNQLPENRCTWRFQNKAVG